MMMMIMMMMMMMMMTVMMPPSQQGGLHLERGVWCGQLLRHLHGLQRLGGLQDQARSVSNHLIIRVCNTKSNVTFITMVCSTKSSGRQGGSSPECKWLQSIAIAPTDHPVTALLFIMSAPCTLPLPLPTIMAFEHLVWRTIAPFSTACSGSGACKTKPEV
jgi:hypothetical protein